MSEGYDTPAPRPTELGSTEPGSAEVGGAEFDQPREGVYEVTTSGYTEPLVSAGGVSTASSTGSDSTTGVAADQAKQVGQDALASSQQVAGVAADQAKSVAAEAGSQARNLVGEARTQLTDQAATQQNNLATWLHSIVDELDEMVGRADGSGHSGQATSLVRQVSGRARGAASWLQDHEPSDLLEETSRFARQRPGMFLALAAAGGLLAGRLTRGLTADNSRSEASQDRALNAHSGRQIAPTVTPTVATAGPYPTAAPVSKVDVYPGGNDFESGEPAGEVYDDDLGVTPRAGVLGDLGPDRGVR